MTRLHLGDLARDWFSIDAAPGLGTIVDILSAEARAAQNNSSLDAMAVRATVSRPVLRIDSGAKAIESLEELWPLLVGLARNRAPKNRKIVALSFGRSRSVASARLPIMRGIPS